jgi:hypothetical protein
VLLRRVLHTCWLMRASVSLRSDWVNCCCRLRLPWQHVCRWLYGWGCLVGKIVLGGGAAITECSQKLLSCLHVSLIPVISCEGMRYSGSPARPYPCSITWVLHHTVRFTTSAKARTQVPECFLHLLLPSSLSMRPVLGPTQCGWPATARPLWPCVGYLVLAASFCDSNVMRGRCAAQHM